MNNCPHCHRTLLSHASARCNWCGEMIPDADYQQEADAERIAYFQHQAERDAMDLAWARGLDVNRLDPLIGPGGGVLLPGPRPRMARRRPITPERTLGMPPVGNRSEPDRPTEQRESSRQEASDLASKTSDGRATAPSASDCQSGADEVNVRFSRIDLD